MKTHVQVLKFGGTSVGNGERIRRVAQIIARTFHDPEEAFPVVVVSAMAKVTDQLLRIAAFVYTNELEAYQQELKALKQKHFEAAEKAVQDSEGRGSLLKELEKAFVSLEYDIANLQQIVEASSLQHVHPETASMIPFATAAVAAWGERLSVLLVAASVSDVGLPAAPVREEVIITNHPTLSGTQQALGVAVGADPLTEETRKNAQAIISPLIERQIVPVVAGFIGHSTSGYVTTLGRNGSDYSASVIGAALDCIEISIYTDVDGVLTADPRLVMNTRLLSALSYAEAARLSWFGAKVLHPRTLIPIAHRNIPVRVRNTFRPTLRGTVVGPEGRQKSGASAITVHRHLSLITVESTDLFGAPESAGQVFALAARAGAAPVAICSSSGHHLSFVVEEDAAASVVALLQHDMGDMGAWYVRSRNGLAACACIGSGFTADPMSPARAITALARERIPIITQGASELGITLIVEDADSERALRSLHRDLIAPVIPLVRHDATVHEKKRGAIKL
ncbi:MAG TPA: aspartate kinase [Ktedonobacter sp.]|jgi:aspartate kinase|nr:aspartate kinase [Ktedonobacter sp.]